MPMLIEGAVGVTVIDVKVGELAVTVRVVDPLIVPLVAVMVLVPDAMEVAKPFEPVTLLIVATAALLELHVAVVVRSLVLPSL